MSMTDDHVKVDFHVGPTTYAASKTPPVATRWIRIGGGDDGYINEVEYEAVRLADIHGQRVATFVYGEPEGIIGYPADHARVSP